MQSTTIRVFLLFIIIFSSSIEAGNKKSLIDISKQGLEINKSLINDAKRDVSINIMSSCMTVGLNSGTTATEIIDNAPSKLDEKTQNKLINDMMHVKAQECVRQIIKYYGELAKIKDDYELFSKVRAISSSKN